MAIYDADYYRRLLNSYESQYRLWGELSALHRYWVLYQTVKVFAPELRIPNDMHAIAILEGWSDVDK